jgi:hypothetical protein
MLFVASGKSVTSFLLHTAKVGFIALIKNIMVQTHQIFHECLALEIGASDPP